MFTAGAANTVSRGVLWINTKQGSKICKNFIAYAMRNSVAIVSRSDTSQPNAYDSSSVVCTLSAHKGRINALTHFIESTDEGALLIHIITADDEGVVQVWSHDAAAPLTEWTKGDCLPGLKASSTTVICLQTNRGVIITASDSEGKIVIWSRRSSASCCFTIVDEWKMTPSQMAYSLCLHLLPCQMNVILFMGSVDARIYVRVANLETIFQAGVVDVFMRVGGGYLSGHEEWVSCLSAVNCNDEGSGVICMFASGSQDSKIRIWKIKGQINSNKNIDKNIAATSLSSSAVVDTLYNDDVDVIDADDGEIEKGGIYEEEDDLSEARLQVTTSVCADGNSFTYSFYLESLLVGHEDWVTSVIWMPRPRSSLEGSGSSSGNGSGSTDDTVIIDLRPSLDLRPSSKPPLQLEHTNSLRLFSSSMDRNMVIWEIDKAIIGGMWSPVIRVGDMGGDIGGSIGANLLVRSQL